MNDVTGRSFGYLKMLEEKQQPRWRIPRPVNAVREVVNPQYDTDGLMLM